MIDFVGRRRIYAIVSLFMIVPSLIGLAVWQFEAGLDFAGGLETEVRFLGDTELDDVSEALDAIDETPEGTEFTVSEGEGGSFVVTGIRESAVAGRSVHRRRPRGKHAR